MKELQELRNEILTLRNYGVINKEEEKSLLTKLNTVKEQFAICGVVSSYVILYNNGDYEHFDGELAKAIEHLKEDRRYSNYGHNGAVLFKGKKVYSIADERTETFFT
jgi:hypothetical protein